MSAERRLAPSFFVVGAPKCGTTALSEYLRGHPEVCFSVPKEPNFFMTDQPGMRQMTSEDQYLRQAFAHQSPRHRIAGEGSVHYILSQTAIPAILSFAPAARIIAMVRNPIELVRSLHQQRVYDLIEDELDFERAWRLQDERRAGRRIPERCRFPLLLQYGFAARLGAHVERLQRQLPPAQLLVLVFDDLVRDPLACYRRTLDFLGLADDGRREFPVLNARRIQSGWYRRIARRVPHGVDRALLSIRGALGLAPFGIRERLGEATARSVAPAPLARGLRAELAACFRDDVALLSARLQRDLGYWLADADAAPAAHAPAGANG